jgi:hypothetical protein
MSKASRREKHKPGKNDPCTCGSGKKFKKCCEGLSHKSTIPNIPPDEIRKKLEEMQALQKQRELQQGLGRPIISLLHKGYRIVTVGNRLYWSKEWKTFHDFLLYYIKAMLGSDWGNAEIAKPFEERHPILQWYHKVCLYQQENIDKHGEMYSAPMTGAVEAYMGLAYNLYLLAHNVKIQSRLIERLKDKGQFHGAYYETYVAAAFIKAGFDLEFEDEDDGSKRHCEFTATCKKTNNKYSVEAKSRQAGKAHAKISAQLYAALKKAANHKRVVFIDVNVPDDADKIENLKWLREALESIRHKENTLTIEGMPAPEAYVFVTNYPCHYNLDSTHYGWAVLAEGFKIPDFKMDTEYSNIRDALRSREKHADMEQLIKSLKDHYEIPATFDGEVPEFAFKPSATRLKIGQKYLIPASDDGKKVMGELTAAWVSETDKLVYGAYKLMDGGSIIATCPLTDEEFSAYKRYPDTFLGVYRKQGKKVESPLELFDFFFESYRNTPKERLLEFMKEYPDFENLKNESQKELAITYCERAVYSAMSTHKGE